MPSLMMWHGLFGHLDFPELHAAFASTDVTTPDLSINIADRVHLMMVEAPQKFASAVTLAMRPDC